MKLCAKHELLQVADIKNHFEQSDSPVEEDETFQDSSGEPMLLEGLREKFSLRDILAAIPPKNVADRLISRYFNSTQNAIGTTETQNKTCLPIS